MEILLGSANPSKVAYFAHQLRHYDVTFTTPAALGISRSPEETGRDPLENALVKAAYYGQFHHRVISQDSALYIRELALDDPRQPGLHIKRRPDGYVMNDEEMLAYYADLAHELGGRVTCWYQDAYAVSCGGKVAGFIEPGPICEAYSFYLVDEPHPARHPGWPLDSISIRPSTGLYFVDSRETEMTAVEEVLEKDYMDRLLAFYREHLGIRRR